MNRIRHSLGASLGVWLAAVVLGFAGASARAQDKLAGSNVDVRTILHFKVSPAALAPLIPAGWELSPPTTGPAAGANVQVTFAEQIVGANAAGVAGTPVRYVLFAMPVKQRGADTANLMIFTGLSPSGAGPYGTNIKAVEKVQRTLRYDAGQALVAESWQLRAGSGEAVEMEAQFARGPVSREKAQSRVYSQVKPEFSRIYRFEQGVDVVRGGDVPAERLAKFSFQAKGGALSRLFDGSEQLVALVSVPWYSREIFLPAP